MNSTQLFRRILTASAVMASALALRAATSDTQTLNFTINEVIEFDAIEASLNFTIASFDAGGNGQNDQTGHYKLLCNANAAQKITVAVDTAFPANTSLDVAVVPPPGATHVGPIIGVGTTATDLVTGVGKVNVAANDINYSFHASVLAATGSFSRTVTFSVVP